MNPMRYHILVVDDEPNIRKLLLGVLEDEGYAVSVAADTQQADAAMDAGEPDLVLLDVQLPGEDGLAWLGRLREDRRNVPVVMMSGHGTIETALEATRRGAIDFIEKPLQPERLLMSVSNGLDLRRLREENRDLRRIAAADNEMVGESAALKAVCEEIALAAPTDARVLITGENGTGKELVARALHAGSDRSGRPFVKINCAAIPSELLESELFGHERGAFTGAVSARRGKFELAQRGTLLLDEIGDMNPTTQAKLLRVLEENEMERVGGERSIRLDVRIFASTNQDLDARIRDGAFREDLYHRLKVVPIHVPPLRDRIEDVAPLCGHFLSHFSRTIGRAPSVLAPGALSALEAYAWPGNVRELRNLMERLVIMSGGPTIEASDIAPLLGGAGSAGEADGGEGTLAQRLEAVERRIVGQALEASGGNIAEAARTLGLDRGNLHRRLARLGIGK